MKTDHLFQAFWARRSRKLRAQMTGAKQPIRQTIGPAPSAEHGGAATQRSLASVRTRGHGVARDLLPRQPAAGVDAQHVHVAAAAGGAAAGGCAAVNEHYVAAQGGALVPHGCVARARRRGLAADVPWPSRVGAVRAPASTARTQTDRQTPVPAYYHITVTKASATQKAGDCISDTGSSSRAEVRVAAPLRPSFCPSANPSAHQA
jgi:hypothetical protein